MSTENKTIGRIRKLLAIANDDRGNRHECASAAAMAAKLMAKYNIEMADVIVEELNKDGSIVDEFISESNYDKKVPNWYNILATCIGQTLDCVCRMKSTINLKGQYKISVQVLGYKQDVEVAKWLFAYINSQFDKLTNEKWAVQSALISTQKQRDPNPAERKKYKDTYRYGLALGICSKIRETYTKESKEEAKTSSGTSLVLVKQQKIEEVFNYKAEYVQIKSRTNSSAFHEGVVDSHKVNINKVIE